MVQYSYNRSIILQLLQLWSSCVFPSSSEAQPWWLELHSEGLQSLLHVQSL